MRGDDHIDFHLVADEHVAIHARLLEWARWVKVRPHGWHVQPMFRQYRSNAWQWHRPESVVPVNVPAALEMEKAVSLLPEKNMEAIRWSYYWSAMHPLEARARGVPHDPLGMSRRLGVSKAALHDLIRVSRTMLANQCGIRADRPVDAGGSAVLTSPHR